ncbi:peptidoglycan-binding domain-containing protein [Sandaracinus amylolyticus]|nr:peptidoglycan-binding domain-containing protein [Sandaracinus amylolyticus]
MKNETQTTGEARILKKGSRGDDVRELQRDLGRLGYDLDADGIFGDATERAVTELQTMFGYTVDGIVGEGTRKLVRAQIGYGWSAKRADAEELAKRAQRTPGSHAEPGGASNVGAKRSS